MKFTHNYCQFVYEFADLYIRKSLTVRKSGKMDEYGDENIFAKKTVESSGDAAGTKTVC